MKLIFDIDIEQILPQIRDLDLVQKAVIKALEDVRAEIEAKKKKKLFVLKRI